MGLHGMQVRFLKTTEALIRPTKRAGQGTGTGTGILRISPTVHVHTAMAAYEQGHPLVPSPVSCAATVAAAVGLVSLESTLHHLG